MIKFVDMPSTIHGCVAQDGDRYIILINKSKNKVVQLVALFHEVVHIIRNDFKHNKSAYEIEHDLHDFDDKTRSMLTRLCCALFHNPTWSGIAMFLGFAEAGVLCLIAEALLFQFGFHRLLGTPLIRL